jgi:hypothetical protein
MNAGRALAFVVSSSFASLLLAQEPPLPAAKTAAPPGAAAAPAKGLVVFVDPVTGKIRPPEPGEVGALTAPPPQAAPALEPPLEMRFGPGGAVGLVLDSRYESFMVVTKKPDGSLAMSCVTDGRKAAAAVAAGAGPAGKTEKAAQKEAVRVP